MSEGDRVDEAPRRDDDATRRFVASLYEELRRIARRCMRGERPDHTLQPTAVVHEAWLRLFGDGALEDLEGGTSDSRLVQLRDREQLCTAGAAAIRRILIEHARKRSRLKRGGDQSRYDLNELGLAAPGEDEDDRMLAVDEALAELAAADRDKARLVELRFFGGLTVEEIAALRRVSPSTVAREWRVVRAWLQSRLRDEG